MEYVAGVANRDNGTRNNGYHRLRVARDFPWAYVDPETNRYKYPTTLREQYDYSSQGAKLDANFIVVPRNTENGSMLQDSLNSFIIILPIISRFIT